MIMTGPFENKMIMTGPFENKIFHSQLLFFRFCFFNSLTCWTKYSLRGQLSLRQPQRGKQQLNKCKQQIQTNKTTELQDAMGQSIQSPG